MIFNQCLIPWQWYYQAMGPLWFFRSSIFDEVWSMFFYDIPTTMFVALSPLWWRIFSSGQYQVRLHNMCLLQNWTFLRSTQTTAPHVNHYSVNHIVDQKWFFSLVHFQASAHLQSRGVQSFVASPISWSFVSFAPNAYFLKSVTSISAFLNFDINHQQDVCTKFCLEIYNLFSS